MAHAVDQARMVEGLPVQEAVQIMSDLVLVRPVLYLRLHILKHLDHLDVRAAVAGALQGTDGRGHDGIGIRQGGGDHMGGEGGIVSAAVLHVEDHADIQDPRLQRRKLAVRAKDMEDIFRHGAFRERLVDEQAVAVMVMAVGLIAVNGQHRTEADELQALTQHIGKGNIIGPVVIGVERQDASCQCIHHILAGGFHDNVADEAGGKASVVDEKFFKFREFFLIGKLVEQEEICNLFVTEPAVLMETGYQIVHFVAPVKKPPVAGNRLPVHHFCGPYI